MFIRKLSEKKSLLSTQFINSMTWTFIFLFIHLIYSSPTLLPLVFPFKLTFSPFPSLLFFLIPIFYIIHYLPHKYKYIFSSLLQTLPVSYSVYPFSFTQFNLILSSLYLHFNFQLSSINVSWKPFALNLTFALFIHLQLEQLKPWHSGQNYSKFNSTFLVNKILSGILSLQELLFLRVQLKNLFAESLLLNSWRLHCYIVSADYFKDLLM